jgi:serine/threonine-protein kinase RsbW
MAEVKSGEPASCPPGLPGTAMSGGQPGGELPARRPQARHAAGSPARAESLVPAMPSWARVFPGTAQQVGAARRFVAALLDGSPFCADAVLIVSELVTNALLHSRSGHPGGLVTVQVTRWRLGVRIAVTDQGSPDNPVIRDAGPGCEMAESGHGLYMVCHLAEHLDWHDDASGRTIHAILGQHPPAHCRHQPDSQPTSPALAPSVIA